MVSEWKNVLLSEVTDIVMGQSPSSADCNDDGKGLPFFQGNAEFGYIYPVPKRYCIKPKKLAEAGDILISVRAPVGDVNIAKETSAIGRGLSAIRPINIERMFLFYFFQHFKPKWSNLQQGSTFEAINKNDLLNLEIPFPPLSEQHKIAAILSSVDEAIEKTEAIIEQTEKVKKGLMQQLLTKGIGHTKFKKTEIGEIPEKWEVRSIDEIAFVNPEALSNKTDNNYEFEYIDISSIEKPGKIGKTARYKFKDAPSRARRLVRTGDTIVSTVRPYLKGFAFIDKEHDGRVCSTGFAVLRPKASIDPLFLFQSILLNNFVEFLKSRMTGSNYPAVTASDIKEYKFGVPTDINEQKEIAKILSIYDRKLGVEEATLIQLTNLKKSLMQSLLTGKVRVKVDDEVVSS